MKTKKATKTILSALAGVAIRKRFEQLEIGRDSDVALWRARPAPRSRLVVGEGSLVETKLVFERAGSEIRVGNRTFVGLGTISCANLVEIGDDVLVAWGTTIFDHGSHSIQFSQRADDVRLWREGQKDWSSVPIRAVRIGNKAWIGYNAIILPGVTVGEGAVVGAGSVVTRDVAPWTVVAGNPAKQIRAIDEKL